MRYSLLIGGLSVAMLGAGCVSAPSDSVVADTKPASTEEARGAGAVVDLSGQGLTAVPAELLQRADVVSLDLSDNALEGALPAEIRHMLSLEELDLSDNRMTGVPAEVGQLSKLRVLDLSNNQLTGLPYELGNLHALELLDLSGNQYSAADLRRIEESLPEQAVIRR